MNTLTLNLKPNFIYIMALVLLILYNLSTYGQNTEASSMFSAYEAFVDQDLEKVKNQMDSLGYSVFDYTQINVQPGGLVDSLTFSNGQSKAYFTSVDIGYLRNVTVKINYEHENAARILDSLASLTRKAGYAANLQFRLEGIAAIFEDYDEHWVIDRRFKNITYSKLNSLYMHVFSTYGKELVLHFTETIPAEVLGEDEIHSQSEVIAYQGNP